MELSYIDFIYSVKEDGVHKQGIGLMMNTKVSKSCLGWEGINSRILVAHFMTKKCRVSVIVLYTRVEHDSHEFYLQLQEQIDSVSDRSTAILLEDFNTLVGRNINRWDPSLGKFGAGKETAMVMDMMEF